MIRITVAGIVVALAVAVASPQENAAAEPKKTQPVADAEQTVLKDYGFGGPGQMCFSPDQKELFRGFMFGHYMSDTATWKKARVFNIGIRMMAYSPDGKLLATAEGTDGARIWNAADPGTQLKQPPDARMELEVSVLEKPTRVLLTRGQSLMQKVLWTAFSPDSSRVLMADSFGHVKIWKTGSWKQEVDIAQTTEPVLGAVFHPDGKSVAFGDAKGGLHLWDLEQRKATRDSPTPAGIIVSVGFSADGTRIATAHPTDVMIWDTTSWVAQIEHGYGTAAFSRDGKVLAIGGDDIRLLEVPSGKRLRTITLPQLSRRETLARPEPNASDQKLRMYVQSLAWQPDGKQLAAGCLDGTVRLVPIDAAAPTDEDGKR